jgi:hypothetical protein
MKKEFWLGAGLFAGLVLFRKPLKRMIVFSAGATMALADKVKEVYLNMSKPFSYISFKPHNGFGTIGCKKP